MKCVLIVLLSLISCQSMNERTFPASSIHFVTMGTEIGSGHSFKNETFHHDGSSDDSSPKTDHHQIPQQTQPHAATLSRIVETKYGKIQGLSITLFPSAQGRGTHPLKNKVVEAFLSIPYASPPVKSHRFSPTQTPIPWDGVRTAVKPGFVCPQVMPDIRDESSALKDMPRGYLEYLRRVEPYLRNQSEDCLYLNIFSPAISSSDPKLLKPVLVFFHGGKFSWGSGNLYDGTLLAAYADFIFISLNYRLGVLGFLNVNPAPTTKPRVANYGLMDQIAALHWIKENILYFNGNADNITLMGYEAGAACIHFLMSSPAVMPGLFHRAILIAGSSHAPWALVDDPAEVANALASSLNCSTSNSSSPNVTVNISSTPAQHMKPLSSQTIDPLMDCLKNKHFSYFAKFLLPKFAVDFGPSIDGIVIRPNFRANSEYQMGKRDTMLSQKYDLLFGLSSIEMLTSFAEADLAYGFEAPRRDSILRTLIRNSYRFHLNEILATVTNEYIDWERSIQHPVSTRDLTLNAVTDSMSLAPVIAASESSQIRKSFFYVFEHSTKDGLYAHQRIGAGGGEELNYFLGSPLIEQVVPFFPSPLPSNYTKSEMALSEILITHLSNFVRTGDPNEPNKGDVTWPLSKERNKFRTNIWEAYDRLHQKYLEISASKIRIRSHYRAHQMAIWLRLVPELQRNGAQYAATAHNRMKGGNDPTLYVGSLRLPQLLEAASEHSSGMDGDFVDSFYNGSGVPPSPPTTCFSPLSSIASSESARGSGGVLIKTDDGKEISEQPSPFSQYTTALSLTIAVGCSLLILNVFIFALVYYRRDKRRTASEIRNSSQFPQCSSEPLKNCGEPPELLKSNSTTATSFHQSQSSEPEQGEVENDFSQASPIRIDENCVVGVSSEVTFSHREVHFSPRPQQSRQSNHYQQHHHHHNTQQQQQAPPHPHSNYTAVNVNNSSSGGIGGMNCCRGSIGGFREDQLLGVATLPRLHAEKQKHQTGEKVNVTPITISPEVTSIATLPKKPTPPTRNFSNYTISQRQIFSLIMSLLSFGIL